VSRVLHQECVQELQKVHPDYAKVQALTAVSLVRQYALSARQTSVRACESGAGGVGIYGRGPLS
jgi:hypothetical protein